MELSWLLTTALKSVSGTSAKANFCPKFLVIKDRDGENKKNPQLRLRGKVELSTYLVTHKINIKWPVGELPDPRTCVCFVDC